MVEKAAYTIEEVREMLSFNEVTIRRAIKSGELKAMKTGRGYRISKMDLEAYYQKLGGGKLFQDEKKSE
jgi:excisionase family DNA binding protein